jgi:hypothetical protein
MWNFIKSKKWYFIHGAFVVAGFLTPSVNAFVVSHPAYTGAVTLGYGWLLHYLDGKQSAAQK